MKVFRAVPLAIALIMLLACMLVCSSSGQGYYITTIHIAAPLKEPRPVACVLVLPLESVDPLHNSSDFIFKGKIEKVHEICVTRHSISSQKKILLFDEWFSSCEVSIEKILYGSVPGIHNKIKVVFSSSSRAMMYINLTQGHEYYFITRNFSEEEKRRSDDSTGMCLFGDVMGSVIYYLFPVENARVTFGRGWPFLGSRLIEPTEANMDSLVAESATIDEESFLKQFTEMIRAAKGD